MPSIRGWEHGFNLTADAQAWDYGLRALVAPYLEAIATGGASSSLAAPFKQLLTSGEYLRDMSREEMVKIVLKEFLKQRLGRQTLIQVAQAGTPGAAHP